MARSNTLPIEPPKRHASKSTNSPPPRSATIQIPRPTKKHHIPHPHLPHHFHHPKDHAVSAPLTSVRPGLPQRQNSVQTRYMSMLLDLDTIPRLHNIAASFFSWILLAGFVVFPATFTSLSTLTDSEDLSGEASDILSKVKHVSLLYTAAFASGIGALGMISLWIRWRKNFVWLLNRIFLPGCLNSLAGFISTIVNIYAQQGGDWSVTARVTAAVTGGSMIVLGTLFALYNFWVLRKVKKMHRREWAVEDHEGEGLVEKIERKAHEPALEPGSVV